MNEHLRPRMIKAGLMRSGKMVAEQIVSSGKNLSIGTDATCTFRLEGEGMPKKLDLLTEENNQYYLTVDPALRGKVSIPAGLLDISKYAEKVADSDEESDRFLKLGATSKGKIHFGDSVVLFQIMASPPQPPIRAMPADMKGGYISRMDISFIVILLISALAHMGMIISVNNMEVSETLDEAETNRFITRITQVDIKDIPPEDDIPEDEALDTEKEKEKENKKTVKKDNKKGGSGNGEAEDKGVESKGLLSLITVDKGEGSVANLINELSTDSGIGDIVNKIGSGISVAKAGDPLTRKGGSGSDVSTVDAGDLGRTGSSQGVGTGEKKVHAVKAKVSSSGGVSGSLSATSVRGKISRYVGGIRYCYEKELKTDPTLNGKVSVSFAISGSGDAGSCSVTANTVGSSSVGSCVCRRINRWKFDPPEDGGSSSVSYTFIFTPAAG